MSYCVSENSFEKKFKSNIYQCLLLVLYNDYIYGELL